MEDLMKVLDSKIFHLFFHFYCFRCQLRKRHVYVLDLLFLMDTVFVIIQWKVNICTPCLLSTVTQKHELVILEMKLQKH